MSFKFTCAAAFLVMGVASGASATTVSPSIDAYLGSAVGKSTFVYGTNLSFRHSGTGAAGNHGQDALTSGSIFYLLQGQTVGSHDTTELSTFTLAQIWNSYAKYLNGTSYTCYHACDVSSDRRSDAFKDSAWLLAKLKLAEEWLHDLKADAPGSGWHGGDDLDVAPVPLPATGLLLLGGLGAFGALRRRKAAA